MYIKYIQGDCQSILRAADYALLNYNVKSSQSQSHIATDGQSVSKSWCRATSGAYDQIFFPFGIRNTSDSYVLHSVGRPL
jgi:hypothetical protein